MRSWPVSVLVALLGGCRALTGSRPSLDVTPPPPTLGVEACPCPLESPPASEPPPPSSVGLAPSIGAVPPPDDVLRRAFPSALCDASPDFVEGFADAMLAMPPVRVPEFSPFDVAVWRAQCTARGLSGLLAPFRGVA